jgi:hypothetical protein
MATTIRYEVIRDRDSVRGGVRREGAVERGAQAEVVPGESIRIFGTDYNHRDPAGRPYDLTFRVGDTCEFGSYNLVYLGTIVAIGAQTVSVREEGGTRVRRFSIYRFTWRHKDFDLAAIRARNAAWMD